jgi:hypothetical protein
VGARRRGHRFSESAEFQAKLIGSMADGLDYIPYA